MMITLNEAQKKAIVKLWEKRLSNKEISQVLGVNESTVGGFTYILNAIKNGREESLRKAFNASQTQGRVKWICDYVGCDYSKFLDQPKAEETIVKASKSSPHANMQDSILTEQLAELREINQTLVTQCSAINRALTKILECWGADIEDGKKGGF